MYYSFIIRKATIEDAYAIKMILQDSFKKYMKDAGLEGKIEALDETIEQVESDIKGKEVYVAFIDDIPVGTIRVEIKPDKTAYISRFGVKVDYQNNGVGKSLMHLVDKLLISQGITCVTLHTASKHRELMKFYYDRNFYVDSTSTDRGYVRAHMKKIY